jgi:hypothetical protein
MTALPSVIAAAPLPPVASHVSTGMVTHLPEATVAAIQREAERRSTTVHVVVEQAWRIARSKIQAAASLDALLGTMRDSAYRGSGQKVPQLVSLPADVEAEIQREAARLDVTVSRIVEAGWVLAVDVMRLTSSLLH